MDFNKINAIGELKQLPLVKLAGLESGYFYTITAARKVNTKYGVGVVLHLSNTHSLFVNSRLANYFDGNPEEFENFQKHIEKGSPTLEYLGGKYNSIRLHPAEGVEANFDKINAVAEFNPLPLVKLVELDVNKLYIITAAYKAQTKHKKGVVLHLDKLHSVFVNDRLAKYFNENPEEFESFLKHIDEGSPTLEYMGRECNGIQLHPDPNIEGANFDNINVKLKELPLMKLFQLKWNHEYIITAAYKVITKYGVSVIFHLDDYCSIFLNKRLNKFFNEQPDQFEALQEEIKRSPPKLRYLGGEYNSLQIHSDGGFIG